MKPHSVEQKDLLSLPPSILKDIASRLDSPSFLALASINRKARALFIDNRFWRQLPWRQKLLSDMKEYINTNDSFAHWPETACKAVYKNIERLYNFHHKANSFFPYLPLELAAMSDNAQLFEAIYKDPIKFQNPFCLAPTEKAWAQILKYAAFSLKEGFFYELFKNCPEEIQQATLMYNNHMVLEGAVYTNNPIGIKAVLACYESDEARQEALSSKDFSLVNQALLFGNLLAREALLTAFSKETDSLYFKSKLEKEQSKYNRNHKSTRDPDFSRFYLDLMGSDDATRLKKLEAGNHGALRQALRSCNIETVQNTLKAYGNHQEARLEALKAENHHALRLAASLVEPECVRIILDAYGSHHDVRLEALVAENHAALFMTAKSKKFESTRLILDAYNNGLVVQSLLARENHRLLREASFCKNELDYRTEFAPSDYLTEHEQNLYEHALDFLKNLLAEYPDDATRHEALTAGNFEVLHHVASWGKFVFCLDNNLFRDSYMHGIEWFFNSLQSAPHLIRQALDSNEHLALANASIENREGLLMLLDAYETQEAIDEALSASKHRALRRAAEKGDPDVLGVLLDSYSAELKIEGLAAKNHKAIYNAVKTGESRCVQLLLDAYQSHPDALQEALAFEDYEIFSIENQQLNDNATVMTKLLHACANEEMKHEALIAGEHRALRNATSDDYDSHPKITGVLIRAYSDDYPDAKKEALRFFGGHFLRSAISENEEEKIQLWYEINGHDDLANYNAYAANSYSTLDHLLSLLYNALPFSSSLITGYLRAKESLISKNASSVLEQPKNPETLIGKERQLTQLFYYIAENNFNYALCFLQSLGEEAQTIVLEHSTKPYAESLKTQFQLYAEGTHDLTWDLFMQSVQAHPQEGIAHSVSESMKRPGGPLSEDQPENKRPRRDDPDEASSLASALGST